MSSCLDIFLNYNSYDPKSRIDELISWFLKFDLDFAAIYFNEPDVTGHAFGPDSQEYKDKVND
jgi:ectonucleotide pyrophosphatase/phosphodiesterase family protein 7